MNIERYLSEHHQGTRRQIFRLLRQGRVTVNGTVITGYDQVDSTDNVQVDGLTVTGRRPQYLMFNKPLGFATDLVPTHPRSLGSLLNDFDRERLLTVVPDLPKAIAGLALASDDTHFVDDVDQLAWPSELTVQLTGKVAPSEAVLRNAAWQRHVVHVDTKHQVVQLTVTTTTVDAAVAVLNQLPGIVGAVVRSALGPLRLPADLSVGMYRGLFPDEIDGLVAPLDATLAENTPDLSNE